MKTKALVTLTLLLASGLTFAAGGLNINNVDAKNYTPTKAEITEITEITVQGPTDAFDVMVKSKQKGKVDTSKLEQTYNGKS